ncbi:MAG: prolyl oligopeptidase family serine peptidase, partial [bacterium]|nr:prolyl oligopeptidase family serine peptidase [bacterium]
MPRLSLCLVFLLLPIANAQQEDLRLLSEWRQHNQRWIEFSHRGSMLLRRLNARAYAALDRRDREVSKLRTAEDWRQRQQSVKRTLNDILGPWPDRTPLNARVLDVIHRPGYRIEKLVYESLPGFHVTAALYIPDGDVTGRPGILYIPGHAASGFRADHYQNICLNLVNKGFVILAYDPIDQGERFQNIDPATGKPFVTRREVPHYKIHSYPGNQCYLAGVSIARYFIWDGIRGIDYLASRPEVDPNRIGVTGNSGGGNMTGFIGAIDDRVSVAVPSCWITSYRRMLAINGIQDAEQNIYEGFSRGIEHADWLLARAPKPTLLLTTTRDFFPIQGARETAAEVRRAYEVLGAPANFAAVEDDHGHGYTRKNNEASYAFLMKHLKVEGDSAERDYPLFRPEQLKVSPSGQVATSFGGETVFSLNRREVDRLLERDAKDPVQSARKLSGYRQPPPASDVVFRGGYQRDGYRVEKYALVGGVNAVVPVAVGLPEAGGPHPAVIYAHPDGKSAVPMDELARAGYVVVAPDLA